MTFQRSPFSFQGKHARACTHTHTHTRTIIYIHTGQHNLTHDTQTIQSHTPMPSTHTSHTHTHTHTHAGACAQRTYPHTPKQSHVWSHAHPVLTRMSQCKHTCAHMSHRTHVCVHVCTIVHGHVGIRVCLVHTPMLTACSQSFAFTHLCTPTVDIPIS